jgi:serine/threonine protein kinase
MAEVFLAVASGPASVERPTVVKRIRPDLADSASFIRMFIDEAALSSQLNHPNIVHTYDFGSVDGSYFIAMEYVPGRDLRYVMSHRTRNAAIPFPVIAVEIARQSCLGLEYAHSLHSPDGAPLSIVHRDVTPANIMIGFDGTVKLLDFGVARSLDHSRRTHTQAGVVKGKVAYLSPEQVRGRPIDRRTDLFSLGIVLYELLTWKRLFARESDFETVKRIVEMVIPPPSSFNPAVKPGLDRIVLRALERDPERRYQSAAEMLDDLEGYLAWSPQSPGLLRRLMRSVARGGPAELSEPVAGSGTLVQSDLMRADEKLNAADQTLNAESCIVAMSTCAPPPTPSSWRAFLAPKAGRADDGRARPLPPATLQSWAGRAAAVTALGLGLMLCVPRSSPPVAASEPARVSSCAVPSSTISISLDSVPQGARVYLDPSGASLGETPLLVRLGRSSELVEYLVRSDGYEPAIAKVIPDQSKPVLVALRALAHRSRSVAAKTREHEESKAREPLADEPLAPLPLFPTSSAETSNRSAAGGVAGGDREAMSR